MATIEDIKNLLIPLNTNIEKLQKSTDKLQKSVDEIKSASRKNAIQFEKMQRQLEENNKHLNS